MGNSQSEKQSKTGGKSPAKSKNFIRNLNRKSPARDSKKFGRKRSDVRRDLIDKTPDSDNAEPIDASDSERLSSGGRLSALGQASVTVPRSATRDAVTAVGAIADCQSVRGESLSPPPPLAVELNLCYYSAESSTHEDLPTLTPLSDVMPIMEEKADEKEEKNDSYEVKDVTVSDDVMGSLLAKGASAERRDHECNHEFRENRLKASPGTTSFTLSKHKKVELSAVKSPEVLENTASPEKDRRHSSLSDVPLTESNVLRKVASLTLDKVVEIKHQKPKFVPEKLNFQLYEKFEGQMLLNWFVSSISENNNFKSLISTHDLRSLGGQYCTHLLAAGVLRQIPDKDAPTESIFKPNLMYYWAHMEAPMSTPITPGRLQMSKWPPDRDSHHPLTQDNNLCSLGTSKMFVPNNNEEISDINEAREVIYQLRRKLEALEFELEKYKITAQIEYLNRNLDVLNTDKNIMERDKVSVTSIETQTSSSYLLYDKLSNEPVINSPENETIANVNSDNMLALSIECTNENFSKENQQHSITNEITYRSDSVENFCKLNKSRDCNNASSKDNAEDGHTIDSIVDTAPSGDTDKNKDTKVTGPIHSNVASTSELSFKTSCMSNDFQSDCSGKLSMDDTKTLDKSSNECLLIHYDRNLDLKLWNTETEINTVEKSTSTSEIKLSELTEKQLTKDCTIISPKSHDAPKLPEVSERSPSPAVNESSALVPVSNNKVMPPHGKVNTKVVSCIPEPDFQQSREMLRTSETSPAKYGVGTTTNSEMPGMVPTAPPTLPPLAGMDMLPSIPMLPSLPISEMGPPTPPAVPLGPPPPPPMLGLSPPPPPPMPGIDPPSPSTMPEIVPPPPPPMPGIGPPPPPPMPGMGPPPPPMPGMGPPPPPMPGMGPPPPPMPGMGPPPPPMSEAGPLPPPMPGVGPPPPPMPGIPPPPAAGPGPLPPPPPAPASSSGPIPFPAPPVGGWNMQRAALRKSAIKPAAPMKPLYWTRILAQPAATPAPAHQEPSPAAVKPLWLEIEEAKLDNIDEFTDLFSRQVVKAPAKKKTETKKTKIQPMKILDSKRSQNVGILAQSLHVEFSEIENAIYNFDTSVVSLEALQQIHELRATEEELSAIRGHLSARPDVPLDRPEVFLHELAGIPEFADRITCFMFQAEFEDAASTTMHKLDNLKHTCEFLMQNEGLKEVLAIILALGNYMNGGNGQRGQADGFGLEILSKLKDVKSKNSQTTLLHFIVRTYMRGGSGTEPGAGVGVMVCPRPLPTPEPGDVARAAATDFGCVCEGLAHLRAQLDACKEKTRKIVEADALVVSPDDAAEPVQKDSQKRLEVFKDKMTTFLNSAEEKLKAENENLEECKTKFMATVAFYQYKPKCGKVEDCEPQEFFSLWTSFCTDFKDIYKKEEQIAIKERLKEAKKQQDERKSLTQPKKEGGLKARLQKLSHRK